MREWPAGEVRRVERAYSPKYECYGYFMLGAFIKNLPIMLREIVDKNDDDDVLLLKCTGKKKSQSGREYYTFNLVGKYSYETLPNEYKDRRGQYPPDLDQGSWECSSGGFMVTGFPLRPWVGYKHPCTPKEFYEKYNEYKYRY
ncbi:MAG TPA: hypothetical protein DCX03_12070 [Bacteroidales bacterium]|nr:hypothetical protein [Bacteroidales bacterium]